MPGTPIVTGHPKTSIETAFNGKASELAIADITRYQEQLLKMILHHDDRALKVLSLYITVLSALVAAAFTLRQEMALTVYLQVLSASASVTLAIGCIFVYRAAWTTRIFLPGRKPDFWIWAMDNDLSVNEIGLAYANQAIQTTAHNEQIANRAAERLARANVCGLAAPIVGAMALWIFFGLDSRLARRLRRR